MIRKSGNSILFAVCAAAMLASCANPYVHTDYNQLTHFGDYKTFSWIDADPLIVPRGGSVSEVSALNRQRIKTAIQEELIGKGFTEVELTADPDFAVSYTVGARDKIDVYSYPHSYRRGWVGPWPYYGDEIKLKTYTQGVLAIDVFDQALKQPVWHGVARKRISGADIENSEEQIKQAVGLILADFPPSLYYQ